MKTLTNGSGVALEGCDVSSETGSGVVGEGADIRVTRCKVGCLRINTQNAKRINYHHTV